MNHPHCNHHQNHQKQMITKTNNNGQIKTNTVPTSANTSLILSHSDISTKELNRHTNPTLPRTKSNFDNNSTTNQNQTNTTKSEHNTTNEMQLQLTDLHQLHGHLTTTHHHGAGDLFVSSKSSTSSSSVSSSSSTSLYNTNQQPKSSTSTPLALTKTATQMQHRRTTDDGNNDDDYDHVHDTNDGGRGGCAVDDGVSVADSISRDRAVSRVETRSRSGSAQCVVAVVVPNEPFLLTPPSSSVGADVVDVDSSQSESVFAARRSAVSSSSVVFRSSPSNPRFSKSVHPIESVQPQFVSNANGAIVTDSIMRLNVPASSMADNPKVIAATATPNHIASMYVGGHQSSDIANPISVTEARPLALTSRDLVVNTATGVCVVNCYSCAIPAEVPRVPNTSGIEMASNRTTVQVHVVHSETTNVQQAPSPQPQLDNRNTNRTDQPTAATATATFTNAVAAPEEPTPIMSTTTATVHQSAIVTSAEAVMSREQRRRERRERRAARQAARMHNHVHPMPSVMRPAFAEILPDILNHHHHQYQHHHHHPHHNPHIHSSSSSSANAPSAHLHVPPPYTALTLNNNPTLSGGHFHHPQQMMGAMTAGMTLVPPPVTSTTSCITAAASAAVAPPTLGAGTDCEGRYSFPLPIIRR